MYLFTKNQASVCACRTLYYQKPEKIGEEKEQTLTLASSLELLARR